ncbi:hypothetical protein AC739_15215, partial [Planococcus glaciei]|uniref:ATP-binding protein n=1 Tax=Planococcus glaciei TaxID=459472 RepID=UPI00069FFF18
MKNKKLIREVFTPRKKVINEKMYVERKGLEERLKEHLNGSKHIVVYGESGSGKTWLCKKVLNDRGLEYGNINLNNVSSNKSLKDTFAEALADRLEFSVKEYYDKSNIGASAVIKSTIEHQTTYLKLKGDPIRDYIASFEQEDLIIVLDNLEAIFNNSTLMEELGNLLMLLDDEKYPARYLVLGVPSGVMNYFINRSALRPISNRMVEVPEVNSMDINQVKEFVNRGYIKELKYNLTVIQEEKIAHYMNWITGGLPQQMHEFGEALARLIEKNNFIFDESLLETGSYKWLEDCLHSVYMTIVDMMNSIETEVGRRNQVLYCLGKINSTTFRANEIEELLKKEFPNSTREKNLAISTTLNDLVEWQNSFITKNKNDYIIKNKQYVLCIRIMLVKNANEKVDKIALQSVSN